MTRMDFLLIAPELWILTMTCVILVVDLFIKEERRGIIHGLAMITLLFAVAQVPMLLLYIPIIAVYFSIAETTPATIFAVWSIFDFLDTRGLVHGIGPLDTF